MDPVVVEQTGQFADQLDFSLIALFMRADWVVQLVMLGLVLASVVTWAIIFEKWRLLRRYNQLADKFEHRFWSGESLQDLYKHAERDQTHALSRVFVAAMREWGRDNGDAPSKTSENTLKRVDRSMTAVILADIATIEERLLFLATVGSAAPFIGLFGTVWGIMNSFQAIAMTRDTNLAVVAPGIAEALFATGLGLLAAIPAVIAYNVFSNAAARYGQRLDNFAEYFMTFVVDRKGKA
jgi:biopolymer transport protein TolQ